MLKNVLQPLKRKIEEIKDIHLKKNSTALGLNTMLIKDQNKNMRSLWWTNTRKHTCKQSDIHTNPHSCTHTHMHVHTSTLSLLF